MTARRTALNNHQGDGLPKHIRRTTKSQERARISPWSRATFRLRTQTGRQQRGTATGESDPKRAYVPKAELQSVKATSLWTSRPVRSAKARAYRFPRKMSRTIDPPNGSN